MNWLLVVVLVILAGHTIKGYRRGLLRVLFSVASLLITVLFVAWATPYVSNFLKVRAKSPKGYERADCAKRGKEYRTLRGVRNPASEVH